MGPRATRYQIEFDADVRRRLEALPAWLSERISDEVASLAELADLAPIPQVGGLTDELSAPPLRLIVADWTVTYRLRRRDRVLRVIDLRRD